MEVARIDFTPERWFTWRKNNRHGSNLLIDIVPHFDYLQAFGQNKLTTVMTYLGSNNYIDKLSGYEITWDGRHVCDRCGAILDETGAAKNVQLAYALGKHAWMRSRVGLCSKCDQEVGMLSKGIESEHKKMYWYPKRMKNDWDKYAWL